MHIPPRSELPTNTRDKLDTSIPALRPSVKLYQSTPLWARWGIWVGLHAILILLISLYSIAAVNPFQGLPFSNSLGVTSKFLLAFTIILSLINLIVFLINLKPWLDACRNSKFVNPKSRSSRATWTICGFVFFTTSMLIVGWIWWFIIPPAVVVDAWNHHCDSYPLTAILEVTDTQPATDFGPVLASFFDTSSGDPLFTYQLNPATAENIVSMNMISVDSSTGTLPNNLYPSLIQMEYDYNNNSYSGICIDENESPGTEDDNPCLDGTWIESPDLEFAFISFSTTNLPAIYVNATLGTQGTKYRTSPPSISLSNITTDGTPGDIILQTAVTQPHDCTRMKVCINGVSGRANGQVGPEVMVPMGRIMRYLAISGTNGICATSLPPV